MCNIAGCRCKHSVNPHLWNLATALFFSNSITIGSYQRCQLLYRVTQSVTTLPICVVLSPKLSCYPLYTEASQFNLLLSFLPDLYIYYLPTFPPCQILSSLSDSLVPGSAVPWGYATLGCLQNLVLSLLCCFQCSQSLGLLWINCVSNISPFPWAESTEELGGFKDNIHVLI